MKYNITQVPFSFKGSYLAFKYVEGNEAKKHHLLEGLYLKTLHDFGTKDPFIAKINLLLDNVSVDYQVEVFENKITLNYQNHKDHQVDIGYSDAETLMFKSNSAELVLEFDFLAKGDTANYIHPIKSSRQDFIVNLSKNREHFFMSSNDGMISLLQDWNGVTTSSCKAMVSPKTNGFLVVLSEENKVTKKQLTEELFDFKIHNNQKKFLSFYNSYPEVPKEFEECKRYSAYVNWSSFVAAKGLLKRDGMLMSKNWMGSIWSWDHCFNALALSIGRPSDAWDQFMILFDFQEPNGKIPDLVNEGLVIKDFVKPPIHGWAFGKLRESQDFTLEQLSEAYKKLSLWTNWWLAERIDSDTGLCQYYHGNDSGWDNSTIFSNIPPIISSDLATFLILQMDELANLAELLNNHNEADEWRGKLSKMFDRLLDELFIDNQPVYLDVMTGYKEKPTSLLGFMVILLGDRLPEAIRTNIISVLKSDKFLTKYGLATEMLDSPKYIDDGYWRGPIWAPSTMLFIEGLSHVGEEAFAKDLAYKFCELVKNNGAGENFNALTGLCQSDPAYTWTASVMLILASEYLMENG